jgi:hypothetical protein
MEKNALRLVDAVESAARKPPEQAAVAGRAVPSAPQLVAQG